MPSAFISYAHEDQEFVLALADNLRAQDGLEVRYDQVVLHVGDSLIRAISREIANGDFLVAVISPDSVESEWCQKELAIAMTDGISKQQVKVLPVRYRGAEMPPMLHDTVWSDADRYGVETVADRLAAAMRAHLEGREEDAAQEAEAASGGNSPPAHAEVVGDAGVAQLESVAQRTWDVLGVWNAVWRGDANMQEIDDPQRRLRWALDVLPDRIGEGLPLVAELANAPWQELADRDVAKVEHDLREELLSVRTQVAQGLPLTRRWKIDVDLGEVSAGGRDASAYLWGVARGDDETARVTVYISGTVMASDDEALPQEVADAKRTTGRSVVTSLLSLDELPPEVMVSTAGIGWPLPDDPSTREQTTVQRRTVDATKLRVFPAPGGEWGQVDKRFWRSFLPVTNGGPGVALNVKARLEWGPPSGLLTETVPTSLRPGESRDLTIRGEPPEDWGEQVRGHLYYGDTPGPTWETRFRIYREGNRYLVEVQETRMLKYADGSVVEPGGDTS